MSLRSSATEPTPKLTQFEVEADGFLYNMVRTMVGTLIEVHALERLHQRVRAAVVEEGVAAQAAGHGVVAATEVEDVVEP